MMAVRPKHALPVVIVAAAGIWHQTLAAEFQCRNGDRTRRIEVASGAAAGDLACAVRYWRDASVAGDGEVLWHARQDADYCAAKARALLERLRAGGWVCAARDQPAATAATPESAAGSAPASAPPAPAPAASLTPEPLRPAEPPAAPAPGGTAQAETPASLEQPAAPAAAPAPPAPAPAASLTPEPAPLRPAEPPAAPAPGGAAQAETPASLEQPAAPAAAPAPSPAPAAGPLVRQARPPAEPPAAALGQPPSAAARRGGPPADIPAAAVLGQVVEQTLRSVEELYGGEFRADNAALGDLDGDGRDDAAVLVTYEAGPDDYVQYLVAYLFDGETFQSIATRNVGGRFLEARRAEMAGIVAGAIVVDLEALDGGAACCETRRAAFALKEGQLVEVGDLAGSDRERTHQTGGSAPG